jgi:hypothetical protein
MVDQPAALSVKLIYIVAIHNVTHDFNLLKSLTIFNQAWLVDLIVHESKSWSNMI